MMKIKKYSILILLFAFIVQPSYGQRITTPENALQYYIHNSDTTLHWVLKDSFSLKGITGYDLLLTSQNWHQYVWKHQLTIFAPQKNKYDGAMLFIVGGHNDTATMEPHWTSYKKGLMRAIAKISRKNKAIVAVLHQVPNQPLFGGKKEDEIISYTLHQYQENPSDFTWPLLFPMVKSAVHAMDAVQYFSKNKLHHPVYRFLVSGASKRGWTTWLTGASDPRVEAIAPMVIDILNMPVNLKHQMEAYGNYSKEIQDYVKLGIVQGLTSSKGKALIEMVDPFDYRKRLTMPKMIFMGTNDPYWVIDNVKNYLPEIPGENLINYTPNAGHGLNHGKVALPALSAFFGITMTHGAYPVCSWNTEEDSRGVTLHIQASKRILLGAKLWFADSETEDFRKQEFESKNLNVKRRAGFEVHEAFPRSGYRAFYVELTYKDPNGGNYTVCTRAFMTDTQKLL